MTTEKALSVVSPCPNVLSPEMGVVGVPPLTCPSHSWLQQSWGNQGQGYFKFSKRVSTHLHITSTVQEHLCLLRIKFPFVCPNPIHYYLQAVSNTEMQQNNLSAPGVLGFGFRLKPGCNPIQCVFFLHMKIVFFISVTK